MYLTKVHTHYFMKKRYYTSILFLLITQWTVAQRQWTWKQGSISNDAKGIYGTLGSPAPANQPGSRMGACTWKDKQGNFWMFGGNGFSESSSGLLNDLWKYNPASNQWTWMGGDKNVNNTGHYGILGLPIFQYPGAREKAVSWTDEQGNFWMFGGSGFAANAEVGFLNDLWKYSPSLNTWSWISGSNRLNQDGVYGDRGNASASNRPGGRFLSTGWLDNDGNFWLFGGFGYADQTNVPGALNDLWRFSPQNAEWAWVNGSRSNVADAHYGKQGDFSNKNTPGGRQGATGWKDQRGRLWLFGGERSNMFYCDLWTYDTDKDEWAWMSGKENTNELPLYEDVGVPTQNGHPGSRSLVSGWVDPPGDLWLFGGIGYGGNSGTNALNNIWKYSLSKNNWTLIKGDAREHAVAVYGTQGTPDSNNKPGGTSNASSWTADDGTFWIFGGRADNGFLNQVWSFTPCESGTITPASAAICEGSSQELTVTGGTSYEWSVNGKVITGENKSKLVATETGTYSVIIKNGTCAVSAYNTAEITRATGENSGGLRYPTLDARANVPLQLTARNAGTHFEWSPGTGLDDPSSATPMATLTHDQEYLIYISSQKGCSVTDTQLVKVHPDSTGNARIFVPTAFTPNGNNINDRLRPLGNIGTINYFRIYNRWGNMLYQTNINGEGWDGKYRGVLQQSDTYTWILSGKMSDGKPFTLSGKTVLIR